MTLYLDTSVLVKLYVDEEGSSQAADLVAKSGILSTSVLAYVEMRSALSRKRLTGGLAAPEHLRAIQRFETEWSGYSVVSIDPRLVRNAGDLAEKHHLRAVDALHLASALTLGHAAGGPVTFLCADRRLTEAAQAEGLEAELVGGRA